MTHITHPILLSAFGFVFAALIVELERPTKQQET